MPLSPGFREIIVLLRQSGALVGRAVWDLLGYGFISLWWVYFRLKLGLIRFLPPLFILIAVIDFLMLLAEGLESTHERIDSQIVPGSWGKSVDVWVHVLGRRLALETKTLVGFSIVSILLAVFMVWHHHRMTERVRQHLYLLSALRHITVEAARLVVSPTAPQIAQSFIENALQVLVDTTTTLKGDHVPWSSLVLNIFRRSGKLTRSATILEQRGDGKGFEAIRQWPPGTYKMPLRVAQNSAAGHALNNAEDTDDCGFNGIVYIPWTYFPHGIRLLEDEKKTPHYCRLGFVKNAFIDLGKAGEPKPRSLICMECTADKASKNRFVLCLDSNRWKCFQEVDFQSAHLIASVVGLVLTELHKVQPPPIRKSQPRRGN